MVGKVGRWGSFETVEALHRQQMFDPSTAHLAPKTLISLDFLFFSPPNSSFPLVANIHSQLHEFYVAFGVLSIKHPFFRPF